MLQKSLYAILTYLFFFGLAYSFATRDQRELIVWILIGILGAGLLGTTGFITVALIRWLFKEREYQPNENGDFSIIRTGGPFSQKQYINLNAIGTSFTIGQEMSLKDFQAMALHRLTSGKFGTPPASVFNTVNPFNQPQISMSEYSAPRIISPNDPIPPLLLEARNIAQEL